MDITVNDKRRGYIMFDSQTDALAAKNAIDEQVIEQHRIEEGPLFDRNISIAWSKTTKFPGEKEYLTNGTHEHVTKRYIFNERLANKNDLIIEYRNAMRNEDEAKNVLRAYFDKQEFYKIRDQIRMESINESAWILRSNSYMISDRIYHNRPLDSGREIINRVANVHIRTRRMTTREWRNIVLDERNMKKDTRKRRYGSNQ